jgi:uncharacterized RmlC-like cupin family protein
VVRLLRRQPQTAQPAPKRKEAHPHGGKHSAAAVNVASGAIAVFFENHGEMTVKVESGNGPLKE